MSVIAPGSAAPLVAISPDRVVRWSFQASSPGDLPPLGLPRARMRSPGSLRAT